MTHGHFEDQNDPDRPSDMPNILRLLHFPQVPPPSLQYLQELQFVQALQVAFPVQRPAIAGLLTSMPMPISNEIIQYFMMIFLRGVFTIEVSRSLVRTEPVWCGFSH